MKLLLGPPGSGKSSYCLRLLQSSPVSTRVVVPTATMAKHFRNELARAGTSFRPSSISTFAGFLEPFSSPIEELSSVALEVIIEAVLKQNPPRRYARAREFAGFRRALAAAVDEYTSAGGNVDSLHATDPDFAAVFPAVLHAARERNWRFRADRLARAAEAILNGPELGTVLVTGFYSFTQPELALLHALSRRSDLTVTLPEWSGAAKAIADLKGSAQVRQMPPRDTGCRRALVSTSTIGNEVNEIARRIRVARDQGRHYRDIGVVLRSELPYAAALQDAFHRYGIPARFYFGVPALKHPTIRYLLALIEASLDGWDHDKTVAAFSLLENQSDVFEFGVRSRTPGKGLKALSNLPGAPLNLLEKLEQLSPWLHVSATPQTWRLRFRRLSGLFPYSPVRDQVSHEQALLWRSVSEALAQWPKAVDEAARLLDPSLPVSYADFARTLELVLGGTELRTPDHRRDVVHVIDAYEARQWKLPVLFVCGMVEKQFPKYHAENPILGDETRRKLQAAGVDLRTSAQRQTEEQFLFDTLLTRATSEIVFSFPELNAKYDANLKSFLLERALPYLEESAIPVRPAPLRSRYPEPLPAIYAEELRLHLQQRHAKIGATAIESYLQCPYQFFAERTLRLQGAPEDPFDRLNLRVQGQIVHTVLERSAREKLPVQVVFDEVWHQTCVNEHIPPSYRSEAVRLEMLQNLEMFAADSRLRPGVESLYEQDVELELEGVRIGCRIDRMEIDAEGYATVIDYKYRVKTGIERTKKGHEEQTHVQGGLYLMAAAKLGYDLGGMVYCGVRKEVSFGGWLVAPFAQQLKQECTEEGLREVMSAAQMLTMQAASNILDGRITPQPADESRCERCSFTSICRVDIAAMKRTLKAGEATAAPHGT